MVREHKTPWSVSIADLSLKPGKTQDIDETMPAPSGIGDDISGINEGAEVRVVGILESLAEGILFTGLVSAPYHAECTRCLEPIDTTITVQPVVFFTYDEGNSQDSDSRGQNGNEEVEIIASQDESEDTYPITPRDTMIDFEALVRDHLAQALPFQPLDTPDCLGLCSQCGFNLNDDPEHQHDIINIQWAALEGLKEKLETEGKK